MDIVNLVARKYFLIFVLKKNICYFFSLNKQRSCYKNCKNSLKCSNTLVNKRERVERRGRKGHYNLRLTIPFIASYSLLLSYITQMTPSPPLSLPRPPTTSLAPSLVLCRSSYVNLSVKRPHKVL